MISALLLAHNLEFAAPSMPLENPDGLPPRSNELAHAPRHRGNGMFVAAGVVGGVALTLKALTTGIAIRDIEPAPDFDDPDFDYEAWAEGPTLSETLLIYGTVLTPAFGTALGLLGGGMAKRGRWQAHRDVTGGIGSPRTLRRREA